MQSSSKSTLMPTLILGALFFIFGFVTWLNATLIPYLKIACKLTNYESTLVAFAFYISYFVMALPSSWILRKTGFKKGMMLGLFVMACGALIFIPAAQGRMYWLFLTGLFIIGTGLTVLQTASNPYVAIVGPLESAARRISIMGICNKVAGVLAPLILGAIILSDADVLEAQLKLLNDVQQNIRLDELASRVILPYICIAATLALLAVLIYFSPLPEVESADEDDASLAATGDKVSVLQFPHLVLGVIALFFYVGVEVIAADTIGTYGQSQQIPLSEAKNFPSYTLAAMVIGYIIGIFSIPRYITQAKALTVSAVMAIAFSLVAIFSSGYVSVLFIALLGLANALMWPAIWPLAISGLGKFTKTGAALLIMAISGGALLTPLYGRLADVPAIGNHHAYWILVPCYCFILFYSTKGHRIKKW